MTTDEACPTFEEWVQYCFGSAYRDFHGTSPDACEVADARRCRFGAMDIAVVTRYLTRLFEAPEFIADQYSDDQIADATWFIFGVGSGYFAEICSAEVGSAEQAACIRAVSIMYAKLFDRVCGRRGTDIDTSLQGSSGVDTAVYMIWDMDQIQYIALPPNPIPHLVEPALEVLESVLVTCRTSTCLVSALHGIGHIVGHSQSDCNDRDVQRLQHLVDRFLENRTIPYWLREYAVHARDGRVQ